VVSATLEVEIGGSWSEASQGKVSARPYLTLNNLKAKGLGGMAQVIEHLPSKLKALSSAYFFKKEDIHHCTVDYLSHSIGCFFHCGYLSRLHTER
jgi:hypothetical protein